MKKLINIILVVFAFVSCENMPIDYKDYDYQAVYFPFQYPVRTLSLGNDKIDNSLDKEHKFHIGVSIGGIYMNNKKDWTVDFSIDNSLVPDYLLNSSKDTLRILPTNYYTLNPTKTITIPSGSFSGLIQVQLTDAFFNDPIAIKGNYVIPLKINSTSADTILVGKAINDLAYKPDRHMESDWESQKTPKDYTLFGIKYINPYHGKWLRRSKIVEKDPSNANTIQTIVIRNKYIERDQIVVLNTKSLNEVISNFVGNNFTSKMNISVSGENVTISPISGENLAAEGNGKFITNGDSWGGKLYDAMHLNYTYKLPNGNICSVTDTLVLRDRGIIIQEARPSTTYQSGN